MLVFSDFKFKFGKTLKIKTMETFQETIGNQLPKKTSGEIISHAFDMYKGIFLYAILAMVIYFIVSMIIQPLSGFDSNSFSEEIRSADGDFSSINIWAIPGMKVYYGLSGIVSLLLSPLYVGIIYIANKYNNQERLQAADLFIGYRQNFVQIVIYSLLAHVIMAISIVMCFLPLFFVIPFLLLGYPVLLFENASFTEAFSKSFKIAKENYAVFLGTSILGLLITISGILLCGIGIVATLPFYFVVMYSTYVAFCGKPRPLIANN